MTVSIACTRVGVFVCCALLAVAGMSSPVMAQANPFAGRWVASEPDHGTVITLTIGSPSTLVFPGSRQDGRAEAFTLTLRNLQTSQQTVTFTVDLPENEGALDLELRLAGTDDVGILRVIRIDGEPADDDLPSWSLRRMP
jgi:hypothetical protein